MGPLQAAELQVIAEFCSRCWRCSTMRAKSFTCIVQSAAAAVLSGANATSASVRNSAAWQALLSVQPETSWSCQHGLAWQLVRLCTALLCAEPGRFC